MTKKLVYKDDSLEVRNTLQNFSYYFVLTINIIKKVWVFFVLYFYARNENGFTYFAKGGNNCELKYDLGINRWIFFFFALFNILDSYITENVGREFGNIPSILTSMISAFSNTVLLTIYSFYNIIYCNTDGLSTDGNVCRSLEYCGVQTIISNAGNQCQNLNKFLLALKTHPVITDLKWDFWFTVLFWTFISFIIIDVLKSIFQFSIPTYGIDNSIKEKVLNAIKSNKKISNGVIGNAAELLLKEQKPNSNNVFRLKKSFFTFLNVYEDLLWVVSMLLNFIALSLVIAWSGWFQYDAQVFFWKYTLTVPLDGTTSLFKYYDLTNRLTYASFGFIGIVLLSYNIHIGDNFNNSVTLVSSLLGTVFSAVLFVFTATYNSYYCNDPKTGYNMCNNRCYFCSVYYALGNNFCTNNAGCSPGYACTDAGSWDPEYVIFFYFVFILFFVNLITFGISIVFYNRINKIFKLIEKYERFRIQANVGARLEYEDDNDLNERVKSYSDERYREHEEMVERIRKYITKPNLNYRLYKFVEGLR